MFPRNLGLYTYSLNNPVNLRDPDGRDWFPDNWNPLGAAGHSFRIRRGTSRRESRTAPRRSGEAFWAHGRTGSGHRVANTLGILAQDAALIFSGPKAAGEAGAGELIPGGTLEEGELYRYTGEGEANVARNTGSVPNTTKAGDPNDQSVAG